MPQICMHMHDLCNTHVRMRGLLRKGLFSHRAVSWGSRQFPWKQLLHGALGLLLCVWRHYFYLFAIGLSGFNGPLQPVLLIQ